MNSLEELGLFQPWANEVNFVLNGVLDGGVEEHSVF